MRLIKTFTKSSKKIKYPEVNLTNVSKMPLQNIAERN